MTQDPFRGHEDESNEETLLARRIDGIEETVLSSRNSDAEATVLSDHGTSAPQANDAEATVLSDHGTSAPQANDAEATVLSDHGTSAPEANDAEATVLSGRQTTRDTGSTALRGRRSRRELRQAATSPETIQVSSSTVRVAYDPSRDGIAVSSYDVRTDREVTALETTVTGIDAPLPITYWDLPDRAYKSQKLLGGAFALGGVAIAGGLITVLLYLLSVIR